MIKQTQPETRKRYLPLILFFIIINGLGIVFGERLIENGIDQAVILAGNLILFLVSLITTYLYSKEIKPQKGHAAVRNVYGGFMIKFFVLAVSVMVYFYFAREINKPAIFACMGLYLVYSFLGTMQALQKKKSVH